MVKPDNLFLSFLWLVFFLIGVGGGIFMIHQSVDQFLQYGVITTTIIKRENEMTMPAITFCSLYNPKDLILSCVFEPNKCKMTNFEMYNRYGYLFYCVQINHGTNVTELAKATGDGKRYGYTIYAYLPSSIPFVITDNSAKIVPENMHQHIHPGQLMEIALSKTNQTALGQTYSNCNETKDYRQINCRVY